MGAVPRPESWRGKRVLVTGHSGFVGGWLCAWLLKLGARVSGFALPPPTNPSFFVLTALGQRLAASITGDLRDAAAVAAAVRGARPQIVFHLAAQPLVRDAWRDPVGTFGSNLMGTVHLLEACRGCAGLEKLVLYTTDKVYGDDPSGRGFCEQDPLGGSEPYSASKTGAEWAVCAYWESYFRRAAPPLAVAKVRAGNILGGGDWARERLLPDAVRAFSEGRPLVVRSPASTRPWQHVLDVVRGTLVLAERLEARDIAGDAIAWNLGPKEGRVHPVSEIAHAAVRAWGPGASWRHQPDASIRESAALVLSSARAERELGWRAAWEADQAVAKSMEWYLAARSGADLAALTERQIEDHLSDAR